MMVLSRKSWRVKCMHRFFSWEIQHLPPCDPSSPKAPEWITLCIRSINEELGQLSMTSVGIVNLLGLWYRFLDFDQKSPHDFSLWRSIGLLTMDRMDQRPSLEEARGWYLQFVQQRADVAAYIAGNLPVKSDTAMLYSLVESVVFKQQAVQEVLSDADPYWAENRVIVKRIVKDHLQQCSDQQQVLPFSPWTPVEKTPFATLISGYVTSSPLYDEQLALHAHHWKLERIALLDRVLIKMALTEAQYLPEIPFAAMLSTYLDIANTYSTPKSASFIHGIVATLAAVKHEKKDDIEVAGAGIEPATFGL